MTASTRIYSNYRNYSNIGVFWPMGAYTGENPDVAVVAVLLSGGEASNPMEEAQRGCVRVTPPSLPELVAPTPTHPSLPELVTRAWVIHGGSTRVAVGRDHPTPYPTPHPEQLSRLTTQFGRSHLGPTSQKWVRGVAPVVDGVVYQTVKQSISLVFWRLPVKSYNQQRQK